MDNANTVNDVVTDSISQNNTLLLGTATPNSLGMLDIASAETFGMFMYNAVSLQQNAQISSSAATTSACARIIQSQSVPDSPAPVTEDSIPPFMPLDESGGISKAIAAAIIKALESGDIDTLKNIQKVISGMQEINSKNSGSDPSPSSDAASSSDTADNGTPGSQAGADTNNTQ